MEYAYLLRLLGDFIHGRSPEPDPRADWQSLTALSQIHNVTGILGYLAMQAPICPDAALQKALANGCKLTVAEYVQRSAGMEALIRQLNNAGIRHILMKGYVLREYYPVPDLRTFGDIDFVILPEDRMRVHRLLTEQGFTVETDWEPVFSYRRGQEFYEVHTDIMEVDVSEKSHTREYFQSMWQHVQVRDGCCLEFTPEYHLIYLLAHLAKHVHGSGAGIRMYLDIAVFLMHFRDGLDWAALETELHRVGLWDFARTVFACTGAWFGERPPVETEPVAPELLERFCSFTMEAGVFGHFNREPGMNDLRSQKASESRMGMVLRKAFPPARQIEKRYTYLQKRPWLLPAAWVHRLVLNRDRMGSRVHEVRTVLSGDRQQAGQLQQLLRDIGL